MISVKFEVLFLGQNAGKSVRWERVVSYGTAPILSAGDFLKFLIVFLNNATLTCFPGSIETQ